MLKKIAIRATTLSLLLCLVLVATSFSASSSAKAHELDTDGTISALLHINPDDDPVAGEPSELLFLISDKEKKFNAENCHCEATVISGGNTLFSSPLFQGKTSYKGIFAPAIAYTFPQKGVYTIRLTGQPKITDGFQKFGISYEVRIEKDANTPRESFYQKGFRYIASILVLVAIIYISKLIFIKK